jgi:hypothetical protein
MFNAIGNAFATTTFEPINDGRIRQRALSVRCAPEILDQQHRKPGDQQRAANRGRKHREFQQRRDGGNAGENADRETAVIDKQAEQFLHDD